MADPTAIAPYLPALEDKIIKTLLFGSRSGTQVSSELTCATLNAVVPDAWSPGREAIRKRMLEAARLNRGLMQALTSDPLLVDKSLIPRAAIGKLGTQRELADAVQAINERAYIPIALSTLEELRKSFGAATGPEALANIGKLTAKLHSKVQAAINGNSVEEVQAFAGDRLERAMDGYQGVTYPTGLENVDKLLNGGLHIGDLMLLSSGAKGAKTMMATSLASSFVDRQIPVRYISMEITALEIEQRVMARLSGVPYMAIVTGTLNKEQRKQIRSRIEGACIDKYLTIIDAASASCDTASILAEIQSSQGGIVIVDHLGLVDSSNSKEANHLFRQQLVAKIVSAVKKTKKLAGIAVAQLNDEGKLAGSKSQNHGITHHLTWMLGEPEREAKIAQVMPIDWRTPTPDSNKPLYFKLDFDRQAFWSLQGGSQEVREYLELKGEQGKAKKPVIPEHVRNQEGL